MAETQNIYIDGGYLRAQFKETMEALFAADPDIDFEELRQTLNGARVFYYDCEDETTPNAFVSELLKRIKATDFYHVRYGMIKGARRSRERQQKEIDVSLAVDMLTHAIEEKPREVTLLSGDLDFRPVVESLTRMGVYVRVVYQPKHASEELCEAADIRMAMDAKWMHQVSTWTFQKQHPIPQLVSAGGEPTGSLIREGSFEGRPIQLYNDGENYHVQIRNYNSYDRYLLTFHDKSFLVDKWLPTTVGPIEWQDERIIAGA